MIKKNKHSKLSYIFNWISGDVLSSDTAKIINSFTETENLYMSAIREISTKLEILNDEFKYSKDRNPIHEIKSRIKTPVSIYQKLVERGHDLSVESARKNLTDIAGIRVICPYINDIYLIADLLTSQADVGVIRRTDYIKDPKPNGYRSLHLIVTIPVFLSDRTEVVNVEVQIRTIAMDFWASLEHELTYKLASRKTEDVLKELRECADIISSTDNRMQNLYNNIVNL
ncbi:MAG: GTP pyrophosphokinase family protein [Bacteroidia bacterium]|nr:GTP pyrophosphokinase family protein [Bacteroidia bacterium]